jgi:eukaryotic-like serine/threonine-protein kinase
LLSLVGSSLLGLQDNEAADAVISQAVEEGGRTLGATHPQTLHARVLRTTAHRYLGRTAKMREDLVLALGNRAHLAIDEGKYGEAETATKEALDAAVATFGERHPETVALARLLAVSYGYNKKAHLALRAAEHAHRLTFEIQQDNPKHPDVIDARAMYGTALANVGRFDEAVEQPAQAVSDATEVFGPSSMMAGFFTVRLALYRLEAGELQPALADAQQGLKVQAELAEPDSYTYTSALNVYGLALLSARRADEALRTLTRVAEILKRALGPSHEMVRSTEVARALALGYSGNLRGAQQEAERMLETYRAQEALPLDRPLDVSGLLQRLAGDPEGGLRAQQEALTAIQPGPRAPAQRMRVLAQIGLDHVELGRHDDASAALAEALALFKAHQKRTTPPHADTLVGLGRVKLGQGRPAEGLPLLEEADRFWRGLDADNRWAGEAALWLGRCYGALGRSADARAALARADRILCRARPFQPTPSSFGWPGTAEDPDPGASSRPRWLL